MGKAILSVFVLFGVGVVPGWSQRPESSGQVPGPQPVQWEYRVLTKNQILELGKNELASGLNRVGGDGWQLVAVEPSQPPTFYFKRPRYSVAEQIEELQALMPRLELDVAVARERADWAERMARKGYAYEANVGVTNQQLKLAEFALDRAKKHLEALTPEPAKTSDRNPKPSK
jgi:hypothetical protein